MTKIFDSNEYYHILDDMHRCCDETQFRYICKECDEFAGCYYCEFDYTEPHSCGRMIP